MSKDREPIEITNKYEYAESIIGSYNEFQSRIEGIDYSNGRVPDPVFQIKCGRCGIVYSLKMSDWEHNLYKICPECTNTNYYGELRKKVPNHLGKKIQNLHVIKYLGDNMWECINEETKSKICLSTAQVEKRLHYDNKYIDKIFTPTIETNENGKKVKVPFTFPTKEYNYQGRWRKFKWEIELELTEKLEQERLERIQKLRRGEI